MKPYQSHTGLIKHPDVIYLFGGSRWSRVIIGVICELVPLSTKLIIHSPRNFVGMNLWLKEKKFNHDITVIKEWPKFDSSDSQIAFVVNQASMHESTASKILESEIPVLIEKPLSITSSGCEKILKLAQKKNVKIAVSQIPLFAEYLFNFKTYISKCENIKSICVGWADTRNEHRYGESKKYDHKLPVFIDTMPHVVSILYGLFTDPKLEFKSLDFLKGGSHLEIEIYVNNIPCQIQLIRNGLVRKRIVKVDDHKDKYQLNFSSEPGVIIMNDHVFVADKHWETNPKPLASMLTAFINLTSKDVYNKYLDPSIALKASKIIDEISEHYAKSRKFWLIDGAEKTREDLDYALKEN